MRGKFITRGVLSLKCALASAGVTAGTQRAFTLRPKRGLFGRFLSLGGCLPSRVPVSTARQTTPKEDFIIGAIGGPVADHSTQHGHQARWPFPPSAGSCRILALGLRYGLVKSVPEEALCYVSALTGCATNRGIPVLLDIASHPRQSQCFRPTLGEWSRSASLISAEIAHHRVSRIAGRSAQTSINTRENND